MTIALWSYFVIADSYDEDGTKKLNAACGTLLGDGDRRKQRTALQKIALEIYPPHLEFSNHRFGMALVPKEFVVQCLMQFEAYADLDALEGDQNMQPLAEWVEDVDLSDFPDHP